MTQIQSSTPIWKRETILAAIGSVISLIVVILLIQAFPELKEYDTAILTVMMSLIFGVMLSVLGTDVQHLAERILAIVMEDGRVDWKDITNVIGELLFEDNGLDSAQVKAVEAKLVQKGYVVTPMGDEVGEAKVTLTATAMEGQDGTSNRAVQSQE